jgi:hypothetical protein
MFIRKFVQDSHKKFFSQIFLAKILVRIGKILIKKLVRILVRFFFLLRLGVRAANNSAYSGYSELWILRYPAHRYRAVPSPGFEPTILWLRVRRLGKIEDLGGSEILTRRCLYSSIFGSKEQNTEHSLAKNVHESLIYVWFTFSWNIRHPLEEIACSCPKHVPLFWLSWHKNPIPSGTILNVVQVFHKVQRTLQSRHDTTWFDPRSGFLRALSMMIRSKNKFIDPFPILAARLAISVSRLLGVTEI